ncbi:MAG TPA: recombinase family protein [Jatrophihabitantaceae bacterium]|jgi:DNA invertase Pin-like site-specific DNA recombinase
MDVVAYARISSDRSGEEAGVGRQLADIRALAATNGDRIIEEVIDNDESAYLRRKPRPGFTRVVDMVKAGEVAGIYTWHPDRLYRSPLDLESLVALVEAHGLVVRTAKAGDIDLGTPTGRMTARVVGSMARYESEHKAERQARQHQQLAEQGKPSGGGRRPFGYLADKVTVEPTEAAALRTAAESILAGGTIAEAARHLSATLNRPVRANILRNLLTGPRVAGKRQHIPAADRRQGVTTPKLTDAVWPAILDLETWQRLRILLLDPARRNTRPPRSYLLSGLLICSLCDAPMTGGNSAYKCSVSSGGCGKMSVSMIPADAHVTAWARRKVTTAKVQKQLAALRAAAPDNGDPLGAEQIEQRRVTLASMFGDGQITPDEWKAARDRLDQRAGQAQHDDAERVRLAEAAGRAVSVMSDWDNAEVSERRATLAALLAGRKLMVDPRGKRNGSTFDADRIRIA